MTQKAPSLGKELDQAVKNFDEFDKGIKSLTMDQMNTAPRLETEEQTKISQVDREKLRENYLKPKRSIGCREKFNEKYRKEFEFQKEYVNFEAENHEIKGEELDIWTRPFPGMPAEEWIVPVNTPVWGPRYLVEQIKRKSYHRLIMKDQINSEMNGSKFFGTMAADSIIQRLDARPVSTRKSFFMGGQF